MPVTIKDIAKRLNTSYVTVSKALRDQPPISQEMRDKIKRAAKEMGYEPNFLSRGLSGGKTRSICILWSLSGPHQSEGMARNLLARIQNRGYVPYLSDHLGTWRDTKKILRDYIQRRVDGVIFQGVSVLLADPEVTKLLSMFKVVVVINPSEELITGDLVVQDRDCASRAVADYFVRTGRRRPVFLGPMIDKQYKGISFWDQLKKHKVEPFLKPNIETDGESSTITQDCWEALNKQFPNEFPFDAIYCNRDEDAVVAMRWLATRNKRVPQDVAVVGFNESPIAAFMNPPLASVARRDDEVAAAVERMLFARLEQPDLPRQVEKISMKFIWRESAGGTGAS
jgi:LacI family transcriptional regulator